MLADNEPHGNAVKRLIGATGTGFDPFREGWIRQSGREVQLSNIANTNLDTGLNLALSAAREEGLSSTYIRLPDKLVEIPVGAMTNLTAVLKTLRMPQP